MGKIFDALEKSRQEMDALQANPKKKTFAADQAGQAEKNIPEALSLSLPEQHNMDKNLITLLDPGSFESSHFKMLRTNLLFAEDMKPPATLLVTSAVPGEGKTFVSANLSVTFAQSINEHVLLLDCDVRRGMLHKVFGLGDNPGLSDHLSRAVPLEDLILKTGVDKLSLLPRGRLPDNPAELLSSKRMEGLIKEIRDRYDDRYIIIDFPPPNLAPETAALARHVDGILVVIKYRGTPRDLISDLIETVGKEKIVGVVVNWVDIPSTGLYGYGKYGKYHKYYTSYSER